MSYELKIFADNGNVPDNQLRSDSVLSFEYLRFGEWCLLREGIRFDACANHPDLMT